MAIIMFETAAVVLFGVSSYIYCSVTPCCNDEWIIKNFTGLRHDFAYKLHGQHLAQRIVPGYIEGHFNNENPSKALVLSFHGLRGVGKSFVSQIIAENMYRDGLGSPFVHYMVATRDYRYEKKVALYKDQLQALIEDGVKKCERSMFIIDEVDKMPPTLMDVIKPYLDETPHQKGVNYHKAIFIFLSNGGGEEISNLVYDCWKTGRKTRENLTLKELEEHVMLSTFHDEAAGLHHSRLIEHDLITAYVPFLPLEKRHVRKCIRDDLVAKEKYANVDQVPEDVTDEVMEELTFFPKTGKIFALKGCRKVSDKVDYVLHRRNHETSVDLRKT